MSIFKESFPRFVRNQLNIREQIIASGEKGGQKSDNFFTYSLNKQCTIRLSSGVNLNDNSEGLIPENKTFTKSQLAKKWVLQGGVLWRRTPDITLNRDGEPSFSNLQLKNINSEVGGFAKPSTEGGTVGAYGNTAMASDAKDGFGIVPMPGIIGVDIKTKSAYGSLREAKINFVCHNQRQLQILELLYMRPGYTLLLEWGWSPYINNENKKVNQFPFINNFFSPLNELADIEKEIYNKKEETAGNYDALMGFVKNFEYTLRPDGGYDCMTEIVAKGEIIEGLKESEERLVMLNAGDNKSGGNFTYSPRNLILLKKIRLYSEQIAGNTDKNSYYEKNQYVQQSYAEIDGPQALKDRWNIGNSLLSEDIESNSTSIYPYILTKEYSAFSTEPKKESNERQGYRSYKSQTTYIRWDVYAHLLNKFVVPLDDKGTPLFTFQTNHILDLDTNNPKLAPLMYNKIKPGFISKYMHETFTEKVTGENKGNAGGNNGGQEMTKRKAVSHHQIKAQNTRVVTTQWNSLQWGLCDVSTNPQVCVLPHTLRQNWYIKYEGTKSLKQKNIFLKDIPENNTLYSPLAKTLSKSSSKESSIDLDRKLSQNEIEYAIGHVYLGVEFLMKTFKDMYYLNSGAVNPKYSLFKFIKKVWESVNGVLAEGHNFDLHIDNDPSGKIVRVVDMQVDTTEVDLSEGKIHELKIQSLDSIVRDVKYNTTIPSSLSSTIAIAAQSSDSINNLDQVSFAAINKGIHDRFASVRNDEKNNIPSTDQIQKWKDVFNGHVYETSRAIGAMIKEKNGAFVENSWSDMGILTRLVAKAEKGNAYIDSEEFGEAPEVYNTARGSLKSIQKSIRYFNSVYGTDDEGSPKKYYLGQPAPVRSPRMSSVIPLKFNARLDGISGLKIGNIFKLPKSRLPYAYKDDDIFFIVMGEQQTLSGQDWVTTIKGHLMLLGDENAGNKQLDPLFKESWVRRNGTFEIEKPKISTNKNNAAKGTEEFKKYAKDKHWSAAFISTICKLAGTDFPVSANHMEYSAKVRKRISKDWKSVNPLSTPLRGGDIIVRNRETNTKTYYDVPYKGDGHADIIIPSTNTGDFVGYDYYNKKSDFHVIGGNLGNTVKKLRGPKTVSGPLITSTDTKTGKEVNSRTSLLHMDEIAVSSWMVGHKFGGNQYSQSDKEGTGYFFYNAQGLSSNEKQNRPNTYGDYTGYRRETDDNDGNMLEAPSRIDRTVVILRCKDPIKRQKIVNLALEHYNLWGQGTLKETDPAAANLLHSYYKNVGMNPPDL